MIPPRAGPAFGPRQAGSNELVQQAPRHGGRGVDEAGALGHGNASAAADFIVQHPAPVALRGHPGASGAERGFLGEQVAGASAPADTRQQSLQAPELVDCEPPGDVAESGDGGHDGKDYQIFPEQIGFMAFLGKDCRIFPVRRPGAFPCPLPMKSRQSDEESSTCRLPIP